MRVNIYVTLKNGVLDPQGKASEVALTSLGFSGVNGVRLGKFIELDIEASDKADAEKKAGEMCEKLLANTVMENFEIKVVG